MPRRKSEQMTPLELEIMQVLWESGPATVQAVQRQLKRELAYTTVQTMLTVLHRKGRVRRTLKEKAYVYRPAVTQKKFTGHAVRDLIDRLFGGSAEGLVLNLLHEKHLTPEKLAALHELIEKEDADDKR
ncbi:MAG TPA: BlaI/MecI/CopY family transcriptional regulator [Pyrinomonadaceae bacterium]|jgi:predicted transcriptional regulator|nr:BlaI/MecI/CopY family transcriptional regulator [Pyrinomonadaceae bacterium]